MIALLDANVLIALVVGDHVHHRQAAEWFAATEEPFATCPSTQGSLLRFLIREGQLVETAVTVLEMVAGHRRHRFWPDEVSFLNVPLAGVVGHRQVTDAYLAALAQAQGGRVATFDKGLAAAHPGTTELVPV